MARKRFTDSTATTRIDMDSKLYDHIKSFVENGEDPIGTELICNASRTKITEKHVLDFIIEEDKEFDICIDVRSE